jgi:hypothetical protein
MQMKGKHISMRAVLVALAVLALAVGLSACSWGGESENDKAHKEQANTRQAAFSRLSHQEKIDEATFSPTRRTINFWVKTWGHDPNKLSYVYMQADNGQLTGYYIFRGLPVTEGAALTENYEFVDPKGDDAKELFQVPAPGVDGVYYSGGQCDVYYGEDALTHSYMEFSLSGGQSFQLYEKPLPRQHVEPLGFTTIEEVKAKEGN